MSKPTLDPFRLTLGAVAALAGGSAQAAGVPAGTLIENIATATYASGAGTASVQSNQVTLRVDEVLDVAVASLVGAPVAAGSAPAVLSFAVTNTGNGNEAFRLSANPSVAGNPFTGTIQAMAVDSNGNGTYEPGVDALIATGGTTPVLAADSAARVFVLVALPAGAADSAISQIRLDATAATGSGPAGTTFAGQGDGGVDAIAGATTAQSGALAGIVARLGAVSLTKSVQITDPFGGTRPVPGALVTYSLVTHLSGTGGADGVVVTDGIPAGTAYQPGTLRLDGTTLTDATDADAGRAGSAGIQVDLGTLPGGSADRTISFTVKIN